MNIQHEISKLGLSGKKGEVYLSILELGRATTIDVARKTGIKRTSVYDLIQDLIHQGYVSEAKRGRRRVFIAEDPVTLIEVYEQRLSDMKSAIPALSSIYTKAIPVPKLKFYDGINGVRHLMEESLTIKGKEHLYWSSISDLVDVFGNRYMEQWVKRRVKRGIWSRCLLVKKKRVADLYLRSDEGVLREIRYLPQGFDFGGVLAIFDNKVMYISSLKESFGFMIESDEFSNSMRLIFKSMWNSLPK